ncbi:MAG: DnaD domain protein [Dehalococcoidia bacterium]|nr:DnaD domain protein [Dehalococcoidia bacterium]
MALRASNTAQNIMNDPSKFDKKVLFHTGQAVIPVPVQFFTEILLNIEDEAELRVALYIWYAITRKVGGQRFILESDITNDPLLANWFTHKGGTERLLSSIDLTRKRGLFIGAELPNKDFVLLPNDEAGQRLLDRFIMDSEVLHDQVQATTPVRNQTTSARSPVAIKYEQEIGIITPSIATTLQNSESRYPMNWILEAISVAAESNARSWRYVQTILENWQKNGRNNGNQKTTRIPTEKSGNHRSPYDDLIRKGNDHIKS